MPECWLEGWEDRDDNVELVDGTVVERMFQKRGEVLEGLVLTCNSWPSAVG